MRFWELEDHTNFEVHTHRSYCCMLQLGYLNVTRLNKTKTIVAVNGQFPGPDILVSYRWHVSMVVCGHRHGVLQLLSNWADGTAYISQCPLGFGETFTHRFRVTGQTGTILWHAHITWLRATLYGPLIIRPRDNQPYPWDPQPVSSIPILVGEWWTQDTEEIERTALRTGGAPTKSDAITINGMPGPLSNHSAGTH
jgi:laccase